MANDANLLTLLEVADRLRLSPHTIRKFVRYGKLQPIRLCRRLLFHPQEISRFVELHQSPPKSEQFPDSEPHARREVTSRG